MNLPEARLSSLKVLVTTMLGQIERLERQLGTDGSELNLQHEVHQFEAALIRSALARTGGRQRRAARLLGVKVTTLNTKIKRHNIAAKPESQTSDFTSQTTTTESIHAN
jgi:DNA-binding NtrC family response regulator